MSVDLNAKITQAQQDAKTAAQEAGKAAAKAAAIAAGGVAAGAVAAGAAIAKSALDAVDALKLKQEDLKKNAGKKMIDQGLERITGAEEAGKNASGIKGKILAFIDSASARQEFEEAVKKASTAELRAARDYALSIMAQPNGRVTEEALKFMLDTINKELDRRGDKVKVVPVPVPLPPFPLGPFCGTPFLMGKH